MKKKKVNVKASTKKVQMKSAGKRAMSSKKVSAKSVKASAKTTSHASRPIKKQSMKSKPKEAPIKSGVPKKRMAQQSADSKQNSEQSSEDIISLILKDHVPLKELIEIMKSEDASEEQKEEAFETFAPLLKRHAKPEEQTVYARMKKDEELRGDGFEGEIEHSLADQLIKEIKATHNDDVWCAKVKVLAELVEHHIDEEEDEMFPDFKEEVSQEERIELGKKYLQLQENHKIEDKEEIPKKLSADAEGNEYKHKDAELVEEDESEEEDTDDSPIHHA